MSVRLIPMLEGAMYFLILGGLTNKGITLNLGGCNLGGHYVYIILLERGKIALTEQAKESEKIITLPGAFIG